MRVSSHVFSSRFGKTQRLVLAFLPDSDDLAKTRNAKGKQARGSVHFELPKSHSQTHPDLYALACLLLVAPFTANRLELDTPVSQHFADAVASNLRIEVTPVSTHVQPRQAPRTGIDAIAFSGGVDSCAALWLYPKSSVAVFLDRKPVNNAPRSMYRPDAAYRTIRAVRRSGRKVAKVGTSLEFVRDPVGFPVDWSNAAPTVLLADKLNIQSVGFGMVAESAYRLGHVQFSELRSRSIYSSWAPVFEAVGLPISLPTAGLSEVVTSRIAADHLARWAPQSCVRGSASRPCGRCFKCFRKTVLEASLSRSAVPETHFETALESAEVKRKISDVPVHHEGVLAYSLHNMAPNKHPLAETLTRMTTSTMEHGAGLSMLERHYSPAIDYVPSHLRESLLRRIHAVAPPMSSEEEHLLQNWNLEVSAKDERYLDARAALRSLTGLDERRLF